MPFVQEITSSILGACRLALRDADGVRWFNLTVEGFWRSFVAALLILPFALLVALVPLPQEDLDVERGFPMVIGLYFLEWVGRAVLLLGLSVVVGRTNRYAGLVIMWNWVAIPEFGLFAVATILSFLISPMAPFFFVIALGGMFAIDYFVTRTALDIGAGPAFGIVVVIFLAQLALGLATAPAPVPA
jgi:hypothetical protein